MPISSKSIVLAMLCAAAVSAEFVGGKATRDALFLTSNDVTALPVMLIATSVFSILLAAGHARLSRRVDPAAFVPAALAASGLLFAAEWGLRSTAPAATAVVVYLHVSGAGPLLASGFWLIASERFDPRTAKRRFGQIAGAGTLGGVAGALAAERVAALLGAPAMLLLLALLQAGAAWLVRRLATGTSVATGAVFADAASTDAPVLRTGLRALLGLPHLRHLMVLVLCGTTSAALVDYLFKTRAVQTFGAGDGLLRFFALYYAATSLLSFVLQMFGSRVVLERFGLGLTTSAPSVALIAGGLGTLVVPGFPGLAVARGGESVFRGSWFRAGYELFFTPLPAAEKRAAKSLIDVALDRLGDAAGGGIVRLAVTFLPLAQGPTILGVAVAIAGVAVLAASQLNRWYIRTLETSLVFQAGRSDWPPSDEGTTSRLMHEVRDRTRPHASEITGRGTVARIAADPALQDILALRSGRAERVVRVLTRDEGIGPGLVPHVIPLLASEALADYALFALRKVAEERVGELTDGLLDPNQPDAVRIGVARVLGVGVSQRAADALVLALDDASADVRVHAARSLAAVTGKNPRVHIDRTRVQTVVMRDADADRLAHVFTLLSLVLPREPLQIAFRGLHAANAQLRGTALEYLEGVLPAPIRQRLWPLLLQAGLATAAGRPAGSRDAARAVGAPGFLDGAPEAGDEGIAGFGRA
jgi:hypothetical protein